MRYHFFNDFIDVAFATNVHNRPWKIRSKASNQRKENKKQFEERKKAIASIKIDYFIANKKYASSYSEYLRVFMNYIVCVCGDVVSIERAMLRTIYYYCELTEQGSKESKCTIQINKAWANNLCEILGCRHSLVLSLFVHIDPELAIRMCPATVQTCEIVRHLKRPAALIRGAQSRIPIVLRRFDFLLTSTMAFSFALFFQKVYNLLFSSVSSSYLFFFF